MPVSDGYFIRKDGSVAERNVFDYIRDHLGYRIELQEMTAPAVLLAGQANPVEISLINRGFSTLFNEHPVYLVLIDESGKVCHIALTDANVNDWQPYETGDSSCTPLLHTISTDLQIPLGLAKGNVQPRPMDSRRLRPFAV